MIVPAEQESRYERVRMEARRELAEMLRAAAREGGRYIDEVTAAEMRGRHANGVRLGALSGDMGALLRDVVREALAADSLYSGRRGFRRRRHLVDAS